MANRRSPSKMSRDTRLVQWKTRDMTWEGLKTMWSISANSWSNPTVRWHLHDQNYLYSGDNPNPWLTAGGSLIRYATNSECHFMHCHSFVWFFSLLVNTCLQCKTAPTPPHTHTPACSPDNDKKQVNLRGITVVFQTNINQCLLPFTHIIHMFTSFIV